tara:strand:+ start:62 stop:622 length:561 start_codon:yes stop_codon:yes gene_type:complete
MSLWGKNDNVTTASSGIITASSFNGTVVGSGTTFTNYEVGQTLTLGIGATAGFGVIESITDNTNMQLKGSSSNIVRSMDAGVNVFQGSADAFTVGARPTSLTEDPNFAPSSSRAQRSYTSKVYGVNKEIQQQRKSVDSKYAPTHAGWVGVTTYVDTHGKLRVKSETFVAMSGITTQTQASGNVLPV